MYVFPVLPDVRGWSDLRSIDLDSNKALSGDLSGLGELKKLAVVVMHDLKLSGTLPATLCGVFECDAHVSSQAICSCFGVSDR